jgi:hypothetical protein
VRAVRSIVIVEAFPGSQLLPEIDVVAIGEQLAGRESCASADAADSNRLAAISARRKMPPLIPLRSIDDGQTQE